jgi:hypothetical protein
MKYIPRFGAVVLISLISLQLYAQDRDFGTWLGFEMERQITKQLRFEFEEEVRIFQNFGEIDRFATSLGGSWTFNQYLRAGAGYTWLYKHRVNQDLWEHRHRYQIYVRGRVKVDRFTLTLRERFQSTYRDESIEGFRYNPRNYLRSRLQAAYNIKGSNWLLMRRLNSIISSIIQMATNLITFAILPVPFSPSLNLSIWIPIFVLIRR